MLPNFLIVGPPKSGTTSLKIYLNKHPDIFCHGETHFFNSNYEKGIEWYKNFFEGHSEKLIGEKTPNYFFNEEVPARVKKHLPDVKLIFIFRNPIDRAYSHYWHNVRKGREDNDTFEKAIRKELNGKTEEVKENYLEISKYVIHVKRWLDYFPKNKMFFLIVERLNNTKLNEILDFLNIDDSFKFGDLKKYNIGGSPRSKTIAKISQNSYVKKIPYLSDFLNRVINMKRGKVPSIDRDIKKELDDYFEKYNIELEKITGLNTNVWKKI